MDIVYIVSSLSASSGSDSGWFSSLSSVGVARIQLYMMVVWNTNYAI